MAEKSQSWIYDAPSSIINSLQSGGNNSYYDNDQIEMTETLEVENSKKTLAEHKKPAKSASNYKEVSQSKS